MAAPRTFKIEYGLAEKGFVGVVTLFLALLAFIGGGMFLDIKEITKSVAGVDKGVAVISTKLETTNKSLDDLGKKVEKTSDQLNAVIGKLPPPLKP